jgi:hypothetical protein
MFERACQSWWRLEVRELTVALYLLPCGPTGWWWDGTVWGASLVRPSTLASRARHPASACGWFVGCAWGGPCFWSDARRGRKAQEASRVQLLINFFGVPASHPSADRYALERRFCTSVQMMMGSSFSTLSMGKTAENQRC